MSWLRTVRMRDEFIRLRKHPRRKKKKFSKRRAERGKHVISPSGAPGRPFQY